MKTVSAYVTAPKHFEFVEEELPELGEHDLLIKTEAVGMCHTDLPVFLCMEIHTYGSVSGNAVFCHEPEYRLHRHGSNRLTDPDESRAACDLPG